MPEKEYIDREKVKNIFEAKAEMAIGTPKGIFYNVVKMLELIPSADVVEVVRCRDCKFFSPKTNFCRCHDTPIYEDDFCSYGERKEE